MNDPHVDWLKYELKTDSRSVRFESPLPIEREYEAFRIRLEDGVLTVELKKHYPSAESAKQRVDAFLTDWVTHAAIEFDRPALDFVFQNARVVDRDPPPLLPGQFAGETFSTLGPITVTATGTVELLTRHEYPAPPSRFKASPDVETMWFRYFQHVEGRETYQCMGYFCLSLLQWSTAVGSGARAKAAAIYRIDRDVLDELGRLSSEKGTPRDARKLDSGSTLVPLTDTEQRWIRAAVKTIIRRKAEYDYDPLTSGSLKQITMADLPKL